MDLMQAVWRSDFDAVDTFLEGCPDINTANRRGWAPLLRSAERGDEAIALRLIESGADIHAADRRGRQALFWASRNGMTDLAHRLLACGAAVDQCDAHGNFPLQQAAMHGRAVVVEMLLDWDGWSKYNRGYQCETAFFLTVRLGRKQIVEAFLKRKHDVNTRPDEWVNRQYPATAPLFDACEAGRLEVVKVLLEHGAAVNTPTGRRGSPIAAAIRRKHEPIIRLLIEHGATIGLEETLVIDDLQLAERLLREGADVESPDKNGETLLVWAAAHGSIEAVKLLLRYGAGIDARCGSGKTALMNAAGRGELVLMELLAKHVDVVSRASDNRALNVAARTGREDAVRWLLEHYNPAPDTAMSALSAAASGGYTNIVRILLDYGVDPNKRPATPYVEVALFAAALGGHKETVSLLLERGADVTLQDRHRNTPTSLAAGTGRWRTLGLLLRKDVPPELLDAALCSALASGHERAAQVMIGAGASPNAATYWERTALMLAASNGLIPVVKELLNRGADPSLEDREGRTALGWAQKQGQDAVVKLLFQWLGEHL